jgi:hypothetical protein
MLEVVCLSLEVQRTLLDDGYFQPLSLLAYPSDTANPHEIA